MPTGETKILEVLEEVYNIPVQAEAEKTEHRPILIDVLNERIDKGDVKENDVLDDVYETATTALVEETTYKPTEETPVVPEETRPDTTLSFFITPTVPLATANDEDAVTLPPPTDADLNLVIDDETEEQTTQQAEVTTSKTSTAADVTTSKEEDLVTTVEDSFEVTTFRPKSKGGFFDNFSLSNLLNFIKPTSTSTTTTEAAKTTFQPATTTTFKALDTTTSYQDAAEETTSDYTTFARETTTVAKEEVVPTEVPEVSTEPETTVAVQTTTTTSAETTRSAEPKTTRQKTVEVTTQVAVENVTDAATDTPTEVLEDIIDDIIDNEIVDETTTSSQETTRSFFYTTERPFRGPLRLKDRLKGYKKTKFRSRIKSPAPSDLVVPTKAVYGTIKREEYIKNWVNRKKYLTTTTTEGTTTSAAAAPVEKIKFAPTVLPNKYFNVEVDHTITTTKDYSKNYTKDFSKTDKEHQQQQQSKKSFFLDKLTSARKTLKQLKEEKSSKKLWSYPRGSDTNVFRSWGGSSLSQAEFERKVLGVSTATEVSVKSMICVRGRCFNADDPAAAGVQ